MTTNQDAFNQQLLTFIDQSPTPFHAVSSMAHMLDAAGFERLYEKASWGQLSPGRYYVTRNDSSIIAFQLTAADLAETGWRITGAHTDSPCLRVKPQPEKQRHQLWQLGVEVYGGALLNPWFDRDLSMAGRVTYRDSHNQLKSALVDFRKPLAVVPSLAIHLDREANTERTVNPQQHLPPVLMTLDKSAETPDFRELLKTQLQTEQPDVDCQSVLDYEISLYDTQPAAMTGLHQDFISAARLDNLLSCFSGLKALLEADNQRPAMLVCNDHEEVGSQSASGAQGTFLKSVLQRLQPETEACTRMIDQSVLISADNAHAIHPNYADRHDSEHGPLLNGGPVIKTNANQRYATSSETSALFRQLAGQMNLPVQDFVVRTDMGCGSTIGPLTAGNIGIQTLDVGVPTFAMHSIRELAGSRDAYWLTQILNTFFNHQND